MKPWLWRAHPKGNDHFEPWNRTRGGRTPTTMVGNQGGSASQWVRSARWAPGSQDGRCFHLQPWSGPTEGNRMETSPREVSMRGHELSGISPILFFRNEDGALNHHTKTTSKHDRAVAKIRNSGTRYKDLHGIMAMLINYLANAQPWLLVSLKTSLQRGNLRFTCLNLGSIHWNCWVTFVFFVIWEGKSEWHSSCKGTWHFVSASMFGKAFFVDCRLFFMVYKTSPNYCFNHVKTDEACLLFLRICWMLELQTSSNSDRASPPGSCFGFLPQRFSSFPELCGSHAL